MNVIVLLAHPSKGSFNHAIAKVCTDRLVADGHKTMVHDLYAEGFDPLLKSSEYRRGARLDDVLTQHCRELMDADGIVIVHPNWWGMPPAILTGWIDRVVRPGVAYKFIEGDKGEGVPMGLLKVKTVVVFNTSDTDEKREMEVFGDPLETIWKNCIFGLCGVPNFERKVFRTVVTSMPEQRQAWLEEAAGTVARWFRDAR